MRIVAVATAVLVVAAGGGVRRREGDDHSTEKITSDRWRRIDLTRRCSSSTRSPASASARSRARASTLGRRRAAGAFVSHTTPLTDRRRARRDRARHLRRAARRRRRGSRSSCAADEPLGVALALSSLALVVHSLSYSGFFEDPATWLALGLAASALRLRPRRPHERRVTGARRLPCSACSARSSRVNVPSLGSDAVALPARRRCTRTGCSGRSSAPPTASGISASSARLPCSRALLVALVAVAGWRRDAWRRSVLVALCRRGDRAASRRRRRCSRSGLRDATEPWFHDNDSTYQIELAGDLVRHGHNPYGHDYDGSGLERFYPAAARESPTGHPQVALTHFAYFPGTALTAAAWGVLPGPARRLPALRPARDARRSSSPCSPFDAPIAVAARASARRSPRARCSCAARGSAPPTRRACSRSCSPSRSLTRARARRAAAALAAAVLLKQFALVALPFFARDAALAARPDRRTLNRAAAAFAAICSPGFLPFLVADPGALWHDTVSYGAGTYRILGYGLSTLLVNAGIIDDRYGSYPFGILASLVWLPVTVWLARARAPLGPRVGGRGRLRVSMFVLLFIARVFQTSYLAWPLTGDRASRPCSRLGVGRALRRRHEPVDATRGPAR